MKAVISELKQERRRLAKELALVDSMLVKAGVGTVRRRRRKTAKKSTAGKKIAAAVKRAIPKTKGNGKAGELEAKRRRAAELKGERQTPADTGGS